MAKSKTILFTNTQNRLAELAKALAHPARIAILEYLIRVERCVCGSIVEELPLSQSTISQHLKALKNAGIIHGDVEGTTVCYCINPAAWGEMKLMMTTFMKKNTNCC